MSAPACAKAALGMAEAATRYGKRGWLVFPVYRPRPGGGCSCSRGPACSDSGKHPALGVHWTVEASADPRVIGEWWCRNPELNVGIATGRASGLVVLDVDGEEGEESLRALIAKHGELPETLEARTGRGRHLYFAHPGDVVIPSSVGRLGAKLDVRSDGGYVVAPPSCHRSGERYRWHLAPENSILAPLPPWLLALLQGSPSAEISPAPPVEAVIPEGGRNVELTSIAGTMRRRGLSPEEIVPALLIVNGRRCAPPLPESEIEAIARSVGRYPPADPPRLEGQVSNEPRDPGQWAAPEWERPIPFEERDLPTFPTASLPPWLRDYVVAEAHATQTPPDLAAMLALSVCSAAIAGRVIVGVRPGFEESTNIFTATVLPPGERKSAVFRDVAAPVDEFEQELVRAAQAQIADEESALAIKRASLEAAQRAAGKAKPADRPTLEAQSSQLAQELAEMRVRPSPRLIVDDCSSERLATLLRDQGGRIAVLAPEGDVFDMMSGRYSASGAPNFGVYLRGHAGDPLRVDRVGRGSESVARPAITLGLAVQPETLRGLARRPGFRGRGLLGRFLFSLPPSALGSRRVGTEAVAAEIRDRYRANLRRLLAVEAVPDSNGDGLPHVLRLTPEALAEFEEFERWIEPQLAEDGELGPIADWAAKLAGAVVRLAGILSMAEGVAEGLGPPFGPITAGTMAAAKTLGRYLIPHALAAFGEMGTDGRLDDARYLLRRIMALGTMTFTKRDIHQVARGRFPRVAAIDEPLAVLEERFYIRIRRRPAPERSGPGRKASETFEVNPALAG